MCSLKEFEGAIVMTLFSRLFKDILALIVAVAVTILIVVAVENNGDNLFWALLAFVCMVPVIASAAVTIKRDWESSGAPDAF
ncbi:MAG: hypothetical protein ACJA0B_001272 [Alcanivorax borkumensis]|jgi:hypothetical protein